MSEVPLQASAFMFFEQQFEELVEVSPKTQTLPPKT